MTCRPPASTALRRILARLLIVLFATNAFVSAGANGAEGTGEARAATVVGIYNGEGTWARGKAALRNFLTYAGYEWVMLSPQDINGAADLADTIDVLWMPGGYAGPYNVQIRATGMRNIRDFVSQGGHLVGTCAGQYFIADRVTWEGVDYDYPLNVFSGSIRGSLHEIIPWDLYVTTEVVLDPTHPINAGFPESLVMTYYGGGDIWPDEGQELQTVASYAVTRTDTIATFDYGSGHVLFMGPHPEIGLNANYTWNVEGGGSAQWEWLKAALDWLLAQ